MSENEIQLEPLTVEVPPEPVQPVKLPYYKNRYFNDDHLRNNLRASKLFKLLGDNEILQVAGYLLHDKQEEVIQVAKINGIQLTRYVPEPGHPYYWVRNGFVCKKIPIESIEKYKGIKFDPSQLVE